MAYRVRKQYEGCYYVFDDEGERVARVSSFLPGPMVHMDGPRIMAPATAKAVARAMHRLANDLHAQEG